MLSYSTQGFLLQVCFTVFYIFVCACFHVSSYYSINVELKFISYCKINSLLPP